MTESQVLAVDSLSIAPAARQGGGENWRGAVPSNRTCPEMANPIGQVISLWPGGGKTALCLQANFHSGAGPQDRRTSCATVHPLPCTESVLMRKLRWSLTRSRPARWCDTRRQRGNADRGLPNCALLRSVGSPLLTFVFYFFAPLQALHGFGVPARALHEGKRAFSDLHGSSAD